MEANKPIEVHLNFYRRLKAFNVILNNIIDGGCFKGSWTEKVKKIYPEANFYLIDANPKYKEDCEKFGKFYNFALGQKDEEREFHFSTKLGGETGNSLYKENTNVDFETKTIHVKKLINVVPDIKYDLIKLDLQGAELEVIEGSLHLFEKTKFVQLECPVHDNNIGAPKFENYINYMSNSGFKVFDCESLFINCKLMAMDVVFVNTALPKVSTLENSKIYYEKKGNDDTPA